VPLWRLFSGRRCRRTRPDGDSLQKKPKPNERLKTKATRERKRGLSGLSRIRDNACGSQNKPPAQPNAEQF